MVFPFYRRFVFIGMSFKKKISVHQGKNFGVIE